jgi:hypothetical protein
MLKAFAIALLLLQASSPDFMYSCEGLNCQFIQTTGSADVQQWNFGNGQESSDHNPLMMYDVAGVYEVTLITAEGSVSHLVSVFTSSRPRCRPKRQCNI